VVLKTVPTGAEYRQKGKHHQRQKQHPQNGVALKKAFEECAHGWVAWSE
jgi:predicted RNA binding protein YcfA (HicA-like mRNA interferase family)